MNQQVVEPHKSIGRIALGMTRDEVRGLFSAPPDIYRKSTDSKCDTFAFCDASVHVYFGGPNDTVDYIEVSPAAYGSICLWGFEVFVTPAQELVEALGRDYEIKLEEGGCTIILEKEDLALWRSDPDGEFFESIGIGALGYHGKVV